MIGVSRGQLYRHIRSGALRPVKDGRRTLFTMKELRLFAERDEKRIPAAKPGASRRVDSRRKRPTPAGGPPVLRAP
jgi:hypothetical protein